MASWTSKLELPILTEWRESWVLGFHEWVYLSCWLTHFRALEHHGPIRPNISSTNVIPIIGLSWVSIFKWSTGFMCWTSSCWKLLLRVLRHCRGESQWRLIIVRSHGFFISRSRSLSYRNFLCTEEALAQLGVSKRSRHLSALLVSSRDSASRHNTLIL